MQFKRFRYFVCSWRKPNQIFCSDVFVLWRTYSLELRRESSWAEEDAVDRRRHGTRKTQLFYHLGDKIICIWKLIKVTFMQCSKKRALVNGGEIICRYYKIHREINQFHGKCIAIPFKRSVWIDITGFISGGFCKSFGRGFPIGHWNPFPIHNINTRAGKFGRIRESFTLYCTRLDTKNPLSLPWLAIFHTDTHYRSPTYAKSLLSFNFYCRVLFYTKLFMHWLPFQ